MIDMNTASEKPVAVALIGTGDGGTIHAETPVGTPDLVIRVVTPAMAILIRFVNSYLTMLVGLLAAAMTSDVIPASDFTHLVMKCAALSFAGPALGILKDLVTIFSKLEGKYPLLTGSI